MQGSKTCKPKISISGRRHEYLPLLDPDRVRNLAVVFLLEIIEE